MTRHAQGGAPKGARAVTLTLAATAMLGLAACASSPSGDADQAAQLYGASRARVGEAPPPVRVFGARAVPGQTAPAQTAHLPETALTRGERGHDGVAGSAAAGAPPKPPELAALPPASRDAPVAWTPARLKGLTVGELKAALGAPTLLSRDGGAQLWQYAGSGCVLHVFLYQDHGTYRVRYTELRIDDPEISNPPTCVDSKRAPQHRAIEPVAAKPTASVATRPAEEPVRAETPGRI